MCFEPLSKKYPSHLHRYHVVWQVIFVVTKKNRSRFVRIYSFIHVDPVKGTYE